MLGNTINKYSRKKMENTTHMHTCPCPCPCPCKLKSNKREKMSMRIFNLYPPNFVDPFSSTFRLSSNPTVEILFSSRRPNHALSATVDGSTGGDIPPTEATDAKLIPELAGRLVSLAEVSTWSACGAGVIGVAGVAGTDLCETTTVSGSRSESMVTEFSSDFESSLSRS